MSAETVDGVFVEFNEHRLPAAVGENLKGTEWIKISKNGVGQGWNWVFHTDNPEQAKNAFTVATQRAPLLAERLKKIALIPVVNLTPEKIQAELTTLNNLLDDPRSSEEEKEAARQLLFGVEENSSEKSWRGYADNLTEMKRVQEGLSKPTKKEPQREPLAEAVAAALGLSKEDQEQNSLGFNMIADPSQRPAREKGRDRTTFPGLNEFYKRMDEYDSLGRDDPEKQQMMWRRAVLEATAEAEGAEGTSGIGAFLQKYDSSFYFVYQVIGETIVGRPNKVEQQYAKEQLAIWRRLYARLGVQNADNWQAFSHATQHLKGDNLNTLFRDVHVNKDRPDVTVADAAETMDSILEFNKDNVYIGDLPQVLEDGMRKVRELFGEVGDLIDDEQYLKVDGSQSIDEHKKDLSRAKKEINVDLWSEANINARYLAEAAKNVIIVSGRPALWGHKDGPPYYWLEKIINFYRQMAEANGAADYFKNNRFDILPPTVLDYLGSVTTQQSKRFANEFDGSSYRRTAKLIEEKKLRGEDLEDNEKIWEKKYMAQFEKYGDIPREIQLLDAEEFNAYGKLAQAKYTRGEVLNEKERLYLQWYNKLGELKKPLLDLLDRPPLNYSEAVKIRLNAKQLKNKNFADDRLRIEIPDPTDTTKTIFVGNPNRVWNEAAHANNELKKAAQGIIDKIGDRAPIQEITATPTNLAVFKKAFRSQEMIPHISKIGMSKALRYIIERSIMFQLAPTQEEQEKGRREGYPTKKGNPRNKGYYSKNGGYPWPRSTIQYNEDKLHGASLAHRMATEKPMDAIQLEKWIMDEVSGILSHDDLVILAEKFVEPRLSHDRFMSFLGALAEVAGAAGSGGIAALSKTKL